VLSHYSVIRLLSDNLFRDEFKDIAALKVNSFVQLGGEIASVKMDTTVIGTLIQLHISQKHAIVVFDDNDKLVANFSTSSVVGVFQNPQCKIAQVLQMPVYNYLKEFHPEYLHCITCSPDATLLDLVRLMSSTHAHRVWIVDQQLHVMGVVSTSDVMRVINRGFFKM